MTKDDLSTAYQVVLLALMGYREARGESRTCRQAVMWVAVTRSLHPRWWGKDLVSVITKASQFTSMTPYGWDPNLKVWPQEDDAVFADCLQDAWAIWQGNLPNPYVNADSYYSVDIPAPSWATEDRFKGQDGRIKFYAVELAMSV